MVSYASSTRQVRSITVNQGAADDEAIVLKSSDIATGLTTAPFLDVKTDHYFTVSKENAANGGVKMQFLAEDAAIAEVMAMQVWGGTANTMKSAAGRALASIFVTEHDGANGFANITAGGNVWGVVARVGGVNAARILLDEGGNLWLAGGIQATFPTADPGVTGQLWTDTADAFTVKMSS